MHKRKDGRNEPIFDPELPIVDAHHHLFEKPSMRYLLDDIVEDVSAGHNIRATVYVESQSMVRQAGPEWLRPVGETEFANGVAAMSASGQYGVCRINAAIVSYADLTLGDLVAETLDAHTQVAPDRFRGIRQVTLWHSDPASRKLMLNPPPKGLMESSDFQKGFSRLAERNLTFDATVFHTQLDELIALADAFPDTRIILNHMGFAMAMGCSPIERIEIFKLWKTKLAKLAQRQNVVTKIGGLGMPFWGFGFNDKIESTDSDTLATAWRPYVETAIELFGPDRCMMESNFPPDGHSCGYIPLWNALKKITTNYSANEKHDLFSQTAARIYDFKIALL